MMSLFSEVFFGQALLWLFIAATLFQLAFCSVALRFFANDKTGGEKALNSCKQDDGRKTASGTDAFNGVTIIVCARNEAPNLRRNLPEILAQKYPYPWELLVVDDASEDETAAVLLDFQQKNPVLRTIRLPEKNHPGKKQALAAGIAAANFNTILLTDADCSPAGKSWISNMTGHFQSDANVEFVLGYGPMTSTPGGGFFEKWTRFETVFTAIQYLSLAYAGMPYMGVGRNLAFRKDVFERSGGFAAHTHLASGDDDLFVNAHASKLNTRICIHPEAFVYSAGKTSLAAWLRQKRRHLSTGSAYKRGHQLLLGLISLSHILHFFLLFVLLLMGIGTKTVLALWLSRSLLLLILYRKAFSALREPRLLSLFPIYDALLAVYYGAFVPIVLIAKKTHSWN